MNRSVELFYKPPKDEVFNELKNVCISFWGNLDDTFGYATEKINFLKNLSNEGCNFSMMVKMIHPISRAIIASNLSLETRNEVSMRIYGWEEDNHDEFDFFNIWNIKNNM